MRSVFLFVLCLKFFFVNSAVIYNDQAEIPGHEGKCYDKNAKVFYSKGEIMRNEGSECVQQKCLGILENTKILRIEYLTCPAVEAGPGCSIIQDRNKPYPDCCPYIVSIPSAQPVSCDNQRREHK